MLNECDTTSLLTIILQRDVPLHKLSLECASRLAHISRFRLTATLVAVFESTLLDTTILRLPTLWLLWTVFQPLPMDQHPFAPFFVEFFQRADRQAEHAFLQCLFTTRLAPDVGQHSASQWLTILSTVNIKPVSVPDSSSSTIPSSTSSYNPALPLVLPLLAPFTLTMTEGFAQQQLVHRLRRVCSLVCDSLCMAHALLPLLPNYSNNTEYSRTSSTRTTLATYSICGQLALPSTPLVEARPILPDCIETNTNGDIMSAGERTLRRIITDTTNNNTTTMNPLRTLFTMPRFRPAFIRPSAELLRPCDDPELLYEDDDLKRNADSVSKLDSAAIERLQDLLKNAASAPLIPAIHTELLNLIPQASLFALGVQLAPNGGGGTLVSIVEHNPMVAVDCFTRLLCPESSLRDQILAELVCMPLSLHSLDVINRLAQLPITIFSTTSNIPLPGNKASQPVISINVSAINGNNNTNGHTSDVVIESLLSNSFLGRYVAHCVQACEQVIDRYLQTRLVRLVSMFMQSLLRNRPQLVPELYVEVQAFCIEFSRVKDAANLFKILKQEWSITLQSVNSTNGGGSPK